jgi:hypothetical protein
MYTVEPQVHEALMIVAVCTSGIQEEKPPMWTGKKFIEVEKCNIM